MKIIEICSAKYADKFLKKNSLVSLCMPCKINVLEDIDSAKYAYFALMRTKTVQAGVCK